MIVQDLNRGTHEPFCQNGMATGYTGPHCVDMGPNYSFLSSLEEAETRRMGSMGSRVLVENPASSDLSMLPHHTFGLRQKLDLPSLFDN